jgi:hypothetical protein
MPPKHGMMDLHTNIRLDQKSYAWRVSIEKENIYQGEHLILVVGFHVAIQASAGYERSKNE